MISLGGIILPEDFMIPDLWTQGNYNGSYRRTVLGRLVKYKSLKVAGRPLDLIIGYENFGFITWGQVKQLMNLDTGNSMVLIYESFQAQVEFRVDDFPYLDFDPLSPSPVLEDSEEMFGTIKLITV